MRLETIEIRHKDHGGVYRAPAKAVAFWQARGWEAVDDTQVPQANTTAPTEPATQQAADTAPAARRSTKKEA